MPALLFRPRRAPSRRLAPALLLLLAACTAPAGPSAPVEGSFGNFRPSAQHAHYLACPQDYCLAKPDEITPLRSVPADRMRYIVREAIDAQPDVVLISEADEGLRLVYQQDGGWLDGLDTVTVEIVDADQGVSGVAIYSESPGGSDMGANRRRVRAWLAAIDAAIARRAAS